MTSDGIADNDWKRMQKIACVIANASIAGDDVLFDSAASEIENALDDLEAKYGKLPTILATRADYVNDPHKKVRFLEQALSLAEHMSDKINQKLTIHSLAELYIDAIHDNEKALFWIDRFSKVADDDGSQRDLERLLQDLGHRE